MFGIISYGFYVPKYRIKTEEIAKNWQKNGQDISDSLGVVEKSIAGVDEDSLTMGFESSSLCLSQATKISKFSLEQIKDNIGSVFFGTETPSYAVNPSSTVIAEFLAIPNNYVSYDTQFACRAATAALVSTFGMVKSGLIKSGLVIASDKANSKPGDALEFTAGSGSVSLLVGQGKNVILEIIDTVSVSSDTPDFWRRTKISYPSHAGRFTGLPAYFKHITQASKFLLSKTKTKPEDYDYAVFHMPNAKFALQVSKILGFSKQQVEDSLVVKYLGNSYTASTLMGLMSVISKAKSGQKIFFCSYGSGAGSDAFVFRVTPNLEKIKLNFESKVKNKEYLEYLTYRKFMGDSENF
jgi:hydroxymethylglutaryl-CoA synthase